MSTREQLLADLNITQVVAILFIFLVIASIILRKQIARNFVQYMFQLSLLVAVVMAMAITTYRRQWDVIFQPKPGESFSETAQRIFNDYFVKLTAQLYAPVQETVVAIIKQMVQILLNLLQTVQNFLRVLVSRVRKLVSNVMMRIYDRLFMFSMQFRTMIIKLREFVLRAQGVLMSLVYTLITGIAQFQAMIEFMKALVRVIVGIAVALSFVLAWFFPVIFVFAVSLATSIGVSLCFGEGTRLRLANGSTCPIEEIGLNATMHDGGRVIGRYVFAYDAGIPMRMATTAEGDACIMSETHGIWDPRTKGWATLRRAVAKNPAIAEAWRPYKYCGRTLIALNTTTEQLRFGDARLATYENEQWDAGFPATTLVQMADGTHKPLAHIKVGDYVAHGAHSARVYGTYEGYTRRFWMCQCQDSYECPYTGMLLSPDILGDNAPCPPMFHEHVCTAENVAYHLFTTAGAYDIYNPLVGKVFTVKHYEEDIYPSTEAEDAWLQQKNPNAK